MRPNTSQSLTAAIALAALLAVSSGARAQDNAPLCNPNTGRTSARIDCLNKMTHALSDKIDALQAGVAQNAQNPKRADVSDYIRQADLSNLLAGYVKYNSPLAINVATEPSTNQKDGSCLAADLAQEGVVIDKPCNYETKSMLKWQLLPVTKISADK